MRRALAVRTLLVNGKFRHKRADGGQPPLSSGNAELEARGEQASARV